MERGLVSVVLVTWNSARYLRRCLEGLGQQTHRNVELLAIDNASSDASAELVAPHAFALIRNDTNRGFSAAVNQGIAIARGEFVLLLNPDCFLLPDYIARLVAALSSSPDLGSATGLLIRAVGDDISATDVIDSAGIRMTRTGRHLDLWQGRAVASVSSHRPSSGLRPPSPHPRGEGQRLEGAREDDEQQTHANAPPVAPVLTRRGEGQRLEGEREDDEQQTHANAPPVAPLPAGRGEGGRRPGEGPSPQSETFEVFGVSGAAAMFRISFLHDVAIVGEAFDEDFFAYREDADLAWRGRLLGWRAVCDPGAVAYHVRRVTPAARRELPAFVNMHSVKNRFLLRLKNQGAYLALRNMPFELARDLTVLIAALTVERSSLPAFPWLWCNRSRVLAKRREIQRRRKVSDRELARWFR